MKKSWVEHGTLKIEKILEAMTERDLLYLQGTRDRLKPTFSTATEDNGF